MIVPLLLAAVIAIETPVPANRKPTTLVRAGSSYTGYVQNGTFYDCEGHRVAVQPGDRFIRAMGSCGDTELRLHSGTAPSRVTPHPKASSAPER